MSFRRNLSALVLSILSVGLCRAEVSWQSIQAGSNPRGLAVGDVDRDGRNEVVVANFGAPSFIGQDLPASQKGTLQVFGLTGASLVLKGEVAVGAGPRSVAVLPGGHIVVSVYGENLLKTYRYHAGRLSEIQSVATAIRPVGLAVGAGVVAVADYGDSKVSLFGLGKDDRLGARTDVATLPGTTAVAVGRLFGGVLPEVAVACLASDKVLILSAEGDDTSGYRAAKTLELPKGSGPADLRLEDVDGDGRMDIVAVLFNGKGVAVFQQKVAGAFEAPVVTALAGSSPNGLTVVRTPEGVWVAVAERDADSIEFFRWSSDRLESMAACPLQAQAEGMGPVEVVCLAGEGNKPLWVTSHMRSGTLRSAIWGPEGAVSAAVAVPTDTPSATRPTPVVEVAKVPLSDATTKVYPNPLKGQGQATIRFTLDEAVAVDVRLFDLAGRQVWSASVPSGNLGENQVVWNGRNAASVPVASGAYVCRISAGKRVVTQKIFVVR